MAKKAQDYDLSMVKWLWEPADTRNEMWGTERSGEEVKDR